MSEAAQKKVIEFGKRCPACRQTKPVTEFYPSRQSKGDGYTAYCKPCGYIDQHKRLGERMKDPELAEKRKRYDFDASLKSRYGITAAEAREMLRRQSGLCANRGCGAPLSFDVVRNGHGRAQVDHCHTTGKVRGILCRRCNTGAAIIERDENVYLGLIDYIALHKP